MVTSCKSGSGSPLWWRQNTTENSIQGVHKTLPFTMPVKPKLHSLNSINTTKMMHVNLSNITQICMTRANTTQYVGDLATENIAILFFLFCFVLDVIMT